MRILSEELTSAVYRRARAKLTINTPLGVIKLPTSNLRMTKEGKVKQRNGNERLHHSFLGTKLSKPDYMNK